MVRIIIVYKDISHGGVFMPNGKLILMICVVVASIVGIYAISRTSANEAGNRPPVEKAVFTGDHRIIYFTSPDVDEHLVRADFVQRDLQAHVAENWTTVTELSEQQRLDALIIHGSALASVNKQWVQQAYLNGVLIAGVRMNANQLAQLVGAPCIATKGFGVSSDGYVMVQLSIRGGTPEERAEIAQANRSNCGNADPVQGIQSEVHVSFTIASDVLDSENYYNQFTQALKQKLDDSFSK